MKVNMKLFSMFFFAVSILMVSCVSQGTYDDMVAERDSAHNKNDSLSSVIRSLNSNILDKSKEISNLQTELNNLKATYAELKKNSSEGALEMINRLEALQKDIDTREKNIAEIQKQFDEIKRQLDERNKFLTSLKDRIAKAMEGVEEGGLTVYIKDSKLYVSLSNKLLFKTGSTVIDQKGVEALMQLANILNQQSDINVLVEGHTDNQPVSASANRFKDNWDLSVLRATEVVRYLTGDGEVDPKRIIASGRSEYFPIEDGDSQEARAKNRRTEIILTPNIDILFDLFTK